MYRVVFTCEATLGPCLGDGRTRCVAKLCVAEGLRAGTVTVSRKKIIVQWCGVIEGGLRSGTSDWLLTYPDRWLPGSGRSVWGSFLGLIVVRLRQGSLRAAIGLMGNKRGKGGVSRETAQREAPV